MTTRRHAKVRDRTGASALRPVRAMAVLFALGLAAAAFSGCASARNELGTVNSDCYIELPAAYDAVHHVGKLAGVRLVPVASLEARAPVLWHAARTGAPHARQVCLFAFSGGYVAGAVSHPAGAEEGRLAVVELPYPHPHLLVTLLVRHPPLPFSHTRI